MAYNPASFEASGRLALGRGVDAEPIPQRGKELAASQRLLKRLTQQFGPGFLDLLLEGLYLAQGFIRAALRVHIEVTIKTDEDGLLIIQQANALFDQPEIFPGWNTSRDSTTTSCAHTRSGPAGLLSLRRAGTVARGSRQQYYPNNKPGQQHRLFYVVMTRFDLTAPEM